MDVRKSFLKKGIDIDLLKECFDRVKNTPFEIKNDYVDEKYYIKCLLHAYAFSLAVNLLQYRSAIRYVSIKDGDYPSHRGVFQLWFENRMIIYHNVTFKELQMFVRNKQLKAKFDIFKNITTMINKATPNQSQNIKDEAYSTNTEKWSRYNTSFKRWNTFYISISDIDSATKFVITEATHLKAINKVASELETYLMAYILPLFTDRKILHDKIFVNDPINLKVSGDEVKESLNHTIYDDCARSTINLADQLGKPITHDTDVPQLVKLLKNTRIRPKIINSLREQISQKRKGRQKR